jgi:hypothetical protein
LRLRKARQAQGEPPVAQPAPTVAMMSEVRAQPMIRLKATTFNRAFLDQVLIVAQPTPTPSPPPAPPPPEPAQPPPEPDDDIYVLGFICKRVAKSPDPDPALTW